MSEPSYLETLNAAQKEAVLHSGSPLLILAGAGSGKTRVITTKIAYLVDRLGVPPWSILAVTFTNKAAAEMRSRVSQLVPGAEEAMVKTFHSFGAWLLRRNSHLLGLNSRFSIYDDDDAQSLVAAITEGLNRRETGFYARWISRAKDYALSPRDNLDIITADPDFAEIYGKYEEKLRAMGNVDFGDLILRSLELLRDNPEVRQRMHQRFRVVLVDEYQDSNVAQYELLKQLTGPDTCLCVVGDDDQSIYKFRGAEVRNILSFPEIFPGTQVIKLEQNYRSTEKILKVASRVVAFNQERLGKTLWTERSGGPTPVVAFLASHEEEAEYCAELLSRGSLEDTAILYRTNAQSLAFETCFARRNIPYRIVGSYRFYEREEIKDILAYLALYNNPLDEVAFKRIINKPKRGLGATAVEKILSALDAEAPDLWAAAEAASSGLSKKAATGAEAFFGLKKLMEAAMGEGAGSGQAPQPLSKFMETVIRGSGLLEYYTEKDEVSSSSKVSNLEELVHAAGNYAPGPEGLTQFLEDLELDRSLTEGEGQDDHGVTLITMHNTKGLEFDRVIITGLEEGLFPSARSESEEELEEERRIFYVSLTRARRELYLTSCRRRQLYGRWQTLEPSLFLSEIPRDVVEIKGRIPPGFSGPALPAGSRDGGYKPGTGVFHDDYGSGVVVKQWYNGSELLVLVRFESGKTAQFIPKYTPLEKVAYD